MQAVRAADSNVHASEWDPGLYIESHHACRHPGSILGRSFGMSDIFARQEATLSDMMHSAARGARRNGFFAVWLVLRACGDLLPPNRVSDRGHQQRLASLTGRSWRAF